MAFQAGDIKISGTFDELSFYHSVFGWLVRRKGGPSRKQFKTSPAFVRSRENSEEFTACARAAASVRHLVITHTALKDKTLYHRLMKLMRLLANDDQHALRGKRDPLKGMQTIQGQTHLKEFRISESLSLYDVLLIAGILKAPQEPQKSGTLVNEHPQKQKEKEFKTTGISSVAIKRRRKKKFYDNYLRLQAPPKRVLLNQTQKQPLLNTAFG